MKEHKILECLSGYLKDEDGRWEIVIPTNNEDPRGENVVSIVLDSIRQMNIGLPDYEYNVSLYVSTHISEDIDGYVFERTTEEIEERIEAVVIHDVPLNAVFSGISIVAAFFDGSDRMIVDDDTGKCNVTHMKLRLVGSF